MIKFLLLFITTLLLISCTNTGYTVDENSRIDNKNPTLIKQNEYEINVDSSIDDKVNWISLFYDKHEQEKEDVIKALKNDFELILKLAEQDGRTVDIDAIPIAMNLIDLNHDGQEEIIAFVSHFELCGTSENGAMYIIYYAENEPLASRIAGFQLDLKTLDDANSKQVGIIRNEEGWDQLFINNIVWETNCIKYY